MLDIIYFIVRVISRMNVQFRRYTSAGFKLVCRARTDRVRRTVILSRENSLRPHATSCPSVQGYVVRISYVKIIVEIDVPPFKVMKNIILKNNGCAQLSH